MDHSAGLDANPRATYRRCCHRRRARVVFTFQIYWVAKRAGEVHKISSSVPNLRCACNSYATLRTTPRRRLKPGRTVLGKVPAGVF